MTPDEIRAIKLDSFYAVESATALFTRELAAQVAEIKELIVKYHKEDNDY